MISTGLSAHFDASVASAFVESLLSKRVVLITGKGGVGRSSVTAALAGVAQSAGRRVLVTDIGADGADYSPLARHFGLDRFPSKPEELFEDITGVRGVTLLARTGQELFLGSVLHNKTIARAALNSDAIRRLVSAGPSFREMGVYFQLLTYLRELREDGSSEHDLILIDMPATGHTLSLTGLPELLLGLVPSGPVAEALREGQQYLNNPETGMACIVTLPETLPVSEALELLDGLRATRMPAGGIVVNRIPRDPFSPGERAALDRPLRQRLVFGAEAFRRTELCRREVARLASQTPLPILTIPEFPAPEGLIDAIGDSILRYHRGEALRHGHYGMNEHPGLHAPLPPIDLRRTIPPAPGDTTIRALLETKRVIVCCGAGGVGKTTAAASLSLAAARMGRRVLVLTIDPSRRLAETLGVSRNPRDPVPLPDDRREAARIELPGSLDAWMLDPKLVADNAVRRLVTNPEEVERVLTNRIYRHVSAMVAGMHEYTAMEALYRLVHEGRYDLVVLDTPPSRNALDFLEAPRVLARLIDNRVFRAFLPDGGLFARAASKFLHTIIATAFGDEFASELTMFMGTFSSIFATLNVDVNEMRDFMSQPEAAFLLVTSPASETLAEAHFFHEKTAELGLPFRGFVLNRSRARIGGRVFPDETLIAGEPRPEARSGLRKLQHFARIEQEAAQRDRKLLAELKSRAGDGALAVAIANLPQGADDMATLVEIANALAAC